MKPTYIKKTVTIDVPTCPKCGGELEEEKDHYARMLYHLKCCCDTNIRDNKIMF